MDIPKILKDYKYKKSPVLYLPILDENGLLIGGLECINVNTLHDQEIIELLTKWRNQNMHWFLTQFNATPVRTKHWIENIILPANDRIVFLVRDKNGCPIGNIGLCNFTEKCVELDNVLRGEASSHKHFFYYAILTVLRWIFKVVNTSRINLHVFSNNTRAIKLYEKVGFSTTKMMSLSKKEFEGDTFYAIDSDLNRSVDFQYQEMTLNKSDFLSPK